MLNEVKTMLYMKCSLFVLMVVAASIFYGCESLFSDDNQIEKVDSLNRRAYDIRYANLDSCEFYSDSVISIDAVYADGRHMAMLNKAFVLYMRMDLAAAVDLCLDVLEESDNELVCFLSNVYLMKISAMTASNKDFYFYKNSAQGCMERVREEKVGMTEERRWYWDRILSEYHLVLSEYYYYLRMEADAINEIRVLEEDMGMLLPDSVQMAKLILINSVSDLKRDEGDNAKFRNVVKACRMCRDMGTVYLSSKSMQLLANELIRTDSLPSYRLENIKGLINVSVGDNDSLPFVIGGEALDLALRYGNMRLVSDSYLTLSDCYFYSGDYESALEYASKALSIVNEHNMAYLGDECALVEFSEVTDSLSVEMKMINSTNNVIVPEWIASVRERLSMIYSAMGMKSEADYNRNIYLDILDITRQDMRMQQRLDSLTDEERMLDFALLVCIGIILLLGVSVFVFIRQQKNKSALRIEKCLSVIDGCRKYLLHSINENPAKDAAIECVLPPVHDSELKPLVDVFADWVEAHRTLREDLNELQRNMQDEQYLLERRIVEKKRDNISKQVSMSIVSGIEPFMNRAIREVEKLMTTSGDIHPEQKQYSLAYLSELVDKINDYNDVMSRWVSMRQGSVNLNVENFMLQPLFDVLAKNKSLFDSKGIELQIDATDLVVKADKALTFFMINTLVDNARKYTGAGGRVLLGAEEKEGNAVCVFIEDTGCGLSDDDVNTILNEKVYDSSQIGVVSAGGDKLNKGFGFGLMSCKGIIDKYRKTSSAFSVCAFGIQSELGKGSRFSFTLPKGILRALQILLCVITLYSCANDDKVEIYGNNEEVLSSVDSLVADSHISTASYYADQAYYSNIKGDYAQALVYVDSAICELNAYHKSNGIDSENLLLCGKWEMPEVEMFDKGANTDYHIILDIRNEAAIASLALKEWDVYHYNNEVYTRLYKVMAQDPGLEGYCEAMERANVNKQTLLVFIAIVVLFAVVLVFVFYYKHTLLPMLNMKQLLWMNRKLYGKGAAIHYGNDAVQQGNLLEVSQELAMGYYQQYVDVLYECVNDIKNADAVALLIFRNGCEDEMTAFSSGCLAPEYLRDLMRSSCENRNVVIGRNGNERVWPLVIGDDGALVGAMAVVFHSGAYTASDDVVFGLLTQFTALNIYYSDMLIELKLVDGEMLEDKKRKAQYEENVLHVQNQILDNCLSTIKHETMYYPNRIKQIVDKMKHNQSIDEDEMHKVSELMIYYRDLYSILHNYAIRQFDKTMFKRRRIDVKDIAEYASATFTKSKRKNNAALLLNIGEPGRMCVVGDEHLVQYLIFCLLAMSFEDKSEGQIDINFEISDGFVKFAFTDNRGDYSSEYLSSLFYPDALSSSDGSTVRRTMYLLICKQIIREHDEYSGHRGCRIFAQPNEGFSGYKLIFTLPMVGKV
jgi:signal transduction histidine kinase/tetratricopeptide (TPR) repeat protein